jgi:hypothetical protein
VGAQRDARARLKQRWLKALQLGAGSLVMATAVSSARPADAAVRRADRSVLERADEVRARLHGGAPSPTLDPYSATVLAWWGNWHNWHGGPGWHNWPNWHNWHNWGNWHNW